MSCTDEILTSISARRLLPVESVICCRVTREVHPQTTRQSNGIRARMGGGSLLGPGFDDHGVGVVDEGAAVEAAGDFPMVEISQAQEELHFVFVDPANRGFGFVDGGDVACSVEQFKFVEGI